jgi:hypothetical protein
MANRFILLIVLLALLGLVFSHHEPHSKVSRKIETIKDDSSGNKVKEETHVKTDKIDKDHPHGHHQSVEHKEEIKHPKDPHKVRTMGHDHHDHHCHHCHHHCCPHRIHGGGHGDSHGTGQGGHGR